MNTSVPMLIYGNELCVALGKFCNPPKRKKKAAYKCCIFYLYTGKELKLTEKG